MDGTPPDKSISFYIVIRINRDDVPSPGHRDYFSFLRPLRQTFASPHRNHFHFSMRPAPENYRRAKRNLLHRTHPIPTGLRMDLWVSASRSEAASITCSVGVSR